MINMKKKKLIELLDSYLLKMDWIPKRESFRELLRTLAGVEGIPDDAMAWCSKFEKDQIPDIEFYIDEMSRYCARELKRIGKLTEENFVENMVYGMNLAVLHELTHIYSGVRNEAMVELITNRLMQNVFMTWHWIPCPKKDGETVTWIECLQCGDDVKHPSCPFRNIRIDSLPREYRYGEYHVTELAHPLKSYYERTNPYTQGFEETYDMLYGKALGWYIESKYDRHCQEVDLKWEIYPNVWVVGSVDLVLDKADRLIELKFYYNIVKLVREGKPNDDHIFQVQTYYTMGLKHKPWLFNKLKRATVVYYSKMKSRGFPRRAELPVELKTIENEIKERARILHTALTIKKPPLDSRCVRWLCNYCKHVICPYHPKHGED